MTAAKRRVLIVDDDDGIVEPVEVALREHGYDVIVARDGSEALVRAERDNPDLVILDVVMPKRSGFMVLDRLRRCQQRPLRIIMVTATCEPKYRDFAESRGIDGFIAKPFDIDDLVAKVDSVLATPA